MSQTKKNMKTLVNCFSYLRDAQFFLICVLACVCVCFLAFISTLTIAPSPPYAPSSFFFVFARSACPPPSALTPTLSFVYLFPPSPLHLSPRSPPALNLCFFSLSECDAELLLTIVLTATPRDQQRGGADGRGRQGRGRGGAKMSRGAAGEETPALRVEGGGALLAAPVLRRARSSQAGRGHAQVDTPSPTPRPAPHHRRIPTTPHASTPPLQLYTPVLTQRCEAAVFDGGTRSGEGRRKDRERRRGDEDDDMTALGADMHVTCCTKSQAVHTCQPPSPLRLLPFLSPSPSRVPLPSLP